MFNANGKGHTNRARAEATTRGLAINTRIAFRGDAVFLLACGGDR